MPWKVQKGNGGWFVVNEDTGRMMNKKAHKTKSEADKQLRALYANYKGKK